jgi:hypothetical protein
VRVLPAGIKIIKICKSKKNEAQVVGWCSDTEKIRIKNNWRGSRIKERKQTLPEAMMGMCSLA